jgi:hypothetical protein
MNYSCRLMHLPNGQWLARHSGSSLGTVEVTAATKEAAKEKLRNELQYRIELCPCSGASGEIVTLQMDDE